jgi:hypothetical protein
MGIKDQINKLKENWLIIVIVVVVVFAMLGGSGNLMSRSLGKSMNGYSESAMMADSYMGRNSGYYPNPGYDDFAPDVEERVIIKTSYMSTEVEYKTFDENDAKLKNIVSTSDAFLLSENVNEYDSGWRTYKTGSYSIKVPTDKYDAVLSQLKDIGKVTSFSDNSQDITGSYTNTKTELEVETARLERYEDMYGETQNVEEKLMLSDRIFDQERRVKYLQESINNVDQKVEYSQVSFSMSEKRSEYSNVVFVKLSELIRNLVNSMNALLNLLFIVLPWLVFYVLFKFIQKLVMKK